MNARTQVFELVCGKRGKNADSKHEAGTKFRSCKLVRHTDCHRHSVSVGVSVTDCHSLSAQVSDTDYSARLHSFNHSTSAHVKIMHIDAKY